MTLNLAKKTNVRLIGYLDYIYQSTVLKVCTNYLIVSLFECE